MPLPPRRPAIALVGLLVITGCSGGGGIPGVDLTAVSGATSTAPVTSSTEPAATSTAPTGPVESSSSTSPPGEPIYCPEGPDDLCRANSSAGAAYLEANVTGGTYGFRFVRLGDGVVASLNPEEDFYPASSLKVLLHLHAVRWAMAQPDPAAALATPIPVYEDPCAGAGAFWTEPLNAVLTAMMIESDNRRADAVLDYFGMAAVAATAAEVAGTTDTLLAHRFGCGGPANDPANRSTALDLSRVYERVAREDVLDAAAFATFTGLMLGPVWPSLQSAVAAQGEALGLAPDDAGAFLSGIELSHKAGWWETNLSVGGLLTLPAGPCAGDSPREYAFAVFVSEAEAVAEGFDVSDVVAVVLREEIRAALQELAVPSCPP
jgi:hypothetical protein